MDDLKTRLWILAASLGGGFIGTRTGEEALTPKQQIGFIAAGCCTAFFLIPWAADYFGLTGVEAVSGLSFVSGIYWKKLVVKAGDVVDLVKLPWGRNPNE